jgi:hypothetical protein
MLRKIALPIMLLAGAFTFAVTPDTRIAAAECGGPGTSLCKTNEACAHFIFFRQCTTEYDYYQTG